MIIFPIVLRNNSHIKSRFYKINNYVHNFFKISIRLIFILTKSLSNNLVIEKYKDVRKFHKMNSQ